MDAKKIGLVLAGCAIAILIGLLTKSWATGRAGRIGVGPLGIEACIESLCRSVAWGEARIATDIRIFAYLSLITGIAAALAAGVFGGLAFTGRRDKLPTYKLGLYPLSAAAFAMAFFALRLIMDADEVSAGWSPLFGIGGVITAGIFLRKLRDLWPEGATVPMSWGTAPHHPPTGQPPEEPPPDGQPAAYGQSPPAAAPAPVAQRCPHCSGSLVFVAQYQRWFCERCQQYA